MKIKRIKLLTISKTLQSLPYHIILYEIFEYLSIEIVYNVFRKTEKDMIRMFFGYFKWDRFRRCFLFFQDMKLIFIEKRLKKIPLLPLKLKNLYIKTTNLELVEFLSLKLPFLEGLHVQCVIKQQLLENVQILNLTKSLLKIWNSQKTKEICFPNLKTFSMNKEFLLSKFKFLLSKCPKLEHVILKIKKGTFNFGMFEEVAKFIIMNTYCENEYITSNVKCSISVNFYHSKITETYIIETLKTLFSLGLVPKQYERYIYVEFLSEADNKRLILDIKNGKVEKRSIQIK